MENEKITIIEEYGRMTFGDYDKLLAIIDKCPFSANEYCPSAEETVSILMADLKNYTLFIIWILETGYETAENAYDRLFLSKEFNRKFSLAFEEDAPQDFYLSESTKKFHLPGCENVKRIMLKNEKMKRRRMEKNKWKSMTVRRNVTRQELLAKGYIPCRACCKGDHWAE